MKICWTKRNITDELKVKDTVELYESLGFIVKVEDFNPEAHPLECNECMKETPEKFKVIYTKPGETIEEEGLFDE